MTDRAKLAFRLFHALIAVAGLVPSLLLFIWVERNMALPWVGTWIGWPLIFVEGGIGWSLAWNAFTIFIFGLSHSGLAGGRVSRPIYIAATGLASLLILATWQPTGKILFQLIPSAVGASLVSFFLYWTLLAFAFLSITRFESAAVFVGLSPGAPESPTGRASPSPTLSREGAYGWVRHPAYLLTLAAWFVTPMLSLDRLAFGIGMAVYLAIGIRLEERRLVAKFGQAYLDYQRTVPMLFPGPRKRS